MAAEVGRIDAHVEVAGEFAALAFAESLERDARVERGRGDAHRRARGLDARCGRSQVGIALDASLRRAASTPGRRTSGSSPA